MSGIAPDHPASQRIVSRRSMVFALPALAALGLGGVFALELNRNPREVPSPLIGRPVPEFDLPPVKGRALGLASANLIGEVSLVNVFASWCTTCLLEHPLFMQLKEEEAVPIHGLNYKDSQDSAARWLNRHGDPYTRTGADRNGRVGIDWGVYGVPETFVVSAGGRVAHKHIGPLTQRDLDETILPLVARLRGSAAEARK